MEPTVATRPLWFGEQPMRMFVKFSKRDDEKRMVYGYASTEALDSEGEIMTIEALEEALPEYMKFANVREMHDPTKAAGKTKEATIDDKGLYIGVKVVDDQAWAKVKEGVYNGFSVGGKKLEKVGNRITKARMKEISLADRPSCPEALFDLWKSADHSQEVTNVPDAKTPEPSRKVFGPLRKTLYDVTEIVKMLDAIVWMRDRIKAEEAVEGHTGSKEPAMLDAAVKFFSDIAQEMLAEETAEVQAKGGEVMEAVDRLTKLAKSFEDALAKMAKADGAEMCEKCKEKKAVEGEKLCKECKAKKEATVVTEDIKKTDTPAPALAPTPAPAPAVTAPAPAPAVEPAPAPAAPVPTPMNEDMKKAFDQQATAIAALTKELEDLRKIAVPARAAATTVASALSKGQDTGVKEIDDLAKVQREAEAKGDARTLIKHINQGIPLLPPVRNGS